MTRYFGRLGTLMIIALSALVTFDPGAHAQAAVPWSWGPILGTVTTDSAALTWKTVRQVGFDFSYSMAQIYDTTGQWDEILTYESHLGVAEIWLQDLLPGTTYRFQLVFYEGDAVYPTEVGTFRTASAGTRAFTFAVYGATASYPDRHKLVADTIARQTDVSLVIHAGGLVEYPSEERFANFLWAMSDLARTRPYLPVIGNHDRETGLYFDIFALPKGGGLRNEQWWSFDYGHVHFIALDSTLSDLTEEAAMQEQTAWLKHDLSQVRDRMIVVFTSDPLYSASYATGENARLLAMWEPLFCEYGVDIVFSSAVHCYEHIYVNGIHHVITGGGGAPLVPSSANVVQGTVFRRYGLLHYVVGTVADDVLQIQVIPVASVAGDVVTLSATGRSIDTFTITRRN